MHVLYLYDFGYQELVDTWEKYFRYKSTIQVKTLLFNKHNLDLLQSKKKSTLFEIVRDLIFLVFLC